MLHALPSHTPWHAHTYTAKSGYNDESLPYATVSHPSATSCTCGRNAFPLQSTLKHPQSYNRTAYFMRISCSHCLKNLRNYLCWMDTISGSRFVALNENVPFFSTSSTCHAFKYFTGLSTSWTRHGCGWCFVITLMTDAEPNSSRLSESRPFPTPPVWKWSGGFCSVVKDCVCCFGT